MDCNGLNAVIRYLHSKDMKATYGEGDPSYSKAKKWAESNVAERDDRTKGHTFFYLMPLTY